MPDHTEVREVKQPPSPPLANASHAQLPRASFEDKRATPEGVVPKQAQGYVIAGLAVVILMAVMFSKDHAKPGAKQFSAAPIAPSTEINQNKIEELEQELSADQRQGQQQQQETRTRNSAPITTGVGSGLEPNQLGSPSAQPMPQQMPQPLLAAPEAARDPIADAEKAMAFKSRFASNLVSASDHATQPSEETIDSTKGKATPPPVPSFDRQVQPATLQSAPQKHAEINLNAAHGQPYALFEGTTIDTTLINRLDGEYAGPVKVMVTNPVYSYDRQHVLIPEGTFLLGDAQKVSATGQKRLAVTFHRMLMPDEYSVDLDQFHGLDPIGDTGLKDQVDRHYLQIFGASIALGVIAGAAESTNANAGLGQSGSEAYTSGIASSLSQSSAHVLDRFLNVLPTLTIREGHRIKVYMTQDLLLPAYENHAVPGDL